MQRETIAVKHKHNRRGPARQHGPRSAKKPVCGDQVAEAGVGAGGPETRDFVLKLTQRVRGCQETSWICEIILKFLC